jgi:hypothetical protein
MAAWPGLPGDGIPGTTIRHVVTICRWDFDEVPYDEVLRA